VQRPRLFAAAAVFVSLSAVGRAGQQRQAKSSAPAASTAFAARIAQLSERGGSFDTDNLLSNEKSYLHIFPGLKERGVTGGAYIGVGPDQNFSYIAQLKPTVAIIVDIRRDNMLEHLLFKALFELAPTRVEYLSLLFGRPPPAAADDFKRADIDRLARYIDEGKPDPAATGRLRARVDATIRTFGVPLSNADFATIDRFHRTFIDAGLSLRYEFQGRQSLPGYYPSYRELLYETGRDGKHWNFLASEADYQFVRSLEGRDLVIPVVGDLGGQTALRAIARYLTARGTRVNAFYASNVESYLSTDGKTQDFLDNLARLPHDGQSVLIRSVFGAYVLPQTVRGYHSTSLVQSIDDLIDGFASGKYKSYNDLLLSR